MKSDLFCDEGVGEVLEHHLRGTPGLRGELYHTLTGQLNNIYRKTVIRVPDRVKSDLSSLRYCTRVHLTCHFLHGTRNTRTIDMYNW